MKFAWGFNIFFVFLFTSNKICAQLEFIPTVTVELKDSQNINGVLLLTTRDNHSRYGAPNHFTSSVQILDPLHPWPPIFFVNAKPGGENIDGNGIYQDVRFQQDTRQITFFFGSPDKNGEKKSMYLICDTNYSVIDTFCGKRGYITGHGFQINSKGERLYFGNTDTVMNLTLYTGDESDSAVLVTTQSIEILDKYDNLLFSWNPLQHIPFSDTYVKLHEIGERNPFVNGWNWSGATAVRFTHDGNIIYSYRFIGVGKINRQNGKIIWKLGGKTPTIPLPPGGEYYRQHDFQEIAPDIYSVFSNGDEDHESKVMIYKIDEKSGTAILEKVIVPIPSVISTNGGNYELEENGSFLLNVGNIISLSDTNKDFEIFDSSGQLLASYFLPCLNHAFQVHLVKSWMPIQPKIFNEAGTLRLSGFPLKVSWYELHGSSVTPVSNELTFSPLKKGTYVAATKAGFGWLVSKPFVY